jgi:hypothetical protein
MVFDARPAASPEFTQLFAKITFTGAKEVNIVNLFPFPCAAGLKLPKPPPAVQGGSLALPQGQFALKIALPGVPKSHGLFSGVLCWRSSRTPQHMPPMSGMNVRFVRTDDNKKCLWACRNAPEESRSYTFQSLSQAV